jgi:hypothetical protein
MKMKRLKKTATTGKRPTQPLADVADVYEANTVPPGAGETGIELTRRDRKWESGKQPGHKI